MKGPGTGWYTWFVLMASLTGFVMLSGCGDEEEWAPVVSQEALNNPPASYTWSAPDSLTNETLYAIYGEGDRLWAASANGTILYSEDGGQTWLRQDSDTPASLRALHGEGDRLWAVGDFGTILYSEDAGSTWTEQASGTDANLLALHGEGNQLWAVGDFGTILYSEDAGSTWTEQASGTDDHFHALHGEGDRLWAVGDFGTILYSGNAGSTWTEQASGTDANLLALHGVGNRLWAVGDFGTILYSEDGGQTWLPQNSGTPAHLYAIHGEGNQLWAVGEGGTMLYTADGGDSWAEKPTITLNNLRAIHGEGATLWAVGSQGVVISGTVERYYPQIAEARLVMLALGDARLELKMQADSLVRGRRNFSRLRFDLRGGDSLNASADSLLIINTLFTPGIDSLTWVAEFDPGAVSVASGDSVYLEVTLEQSGFRQRYQLPLLRYDRWGWVKKNPLSVVFAALILAGFIVVLLRNVLPLWFIRAFPIFASPSLVLNAWNKKYGALSSEFNKLKAVEERQSYIPLPVRFGDRATGTVQEDPLPLLRKHLYLSKPGIIEIIGPLGVGKSTLAFQIAQDPDQRMIPILIDEETTDLAETIKTRLEGWLRVKIHPSVLKNLLRKKRLLVIVDNLSARSPETQAHLRTILSEYPVNALIITSEYPAKFQRDSLKVYPQTIPPHQLLSFITRVLAKQESEALRLLEDQIALAENVASRLTQQRTARTTPLLVTLAVQNAIEHAEYTGSSTTPQPETPTRGMGEPSEVTAPIVLEWVKIRNFKNIEHLDLDFTEPSALDGNWTCIAGINGAGKTSILQAICLLLLGKELVQQLGGDLLKRMLRRVGDQRKDATLTAGVREGDQKYILYLPLSERFVNAVDEEKLQVHTGYEGMFYIWERLRHQVFVSYGASRNLSDHKETRYKNLSLHARQQMTLFDPMTQIASVDVLLEGGSDAIAPLDTLHRLLKIILREELTVEDPRVSEANKLFFTLKGTDGEQDTHIEAIDLPDGFRSTVAWLADLCSAWHQHLPESKEKDRDPEQITGIVLLDEINLHLHPGLERTLVSRLRKALPKVQFIVTTHSPLVLASFDRDELVVLDKNTPGGVKPLDRQVFGMTMDDIYAYLMDVEPESIVLDEMLEDEDIDQDLIKYLYQSKTVNEEDAERLLEERKAMVRALRGEEKA